MPFIVESTELKPWFGNDYEVEFRETLLYQNYRRENDLFATLGVAYPFKRYCGEFEATAARTRHQRRGWDNFRITGRYQWQNDIKKDPFSLVTGITIGQALSKAVRDISSFHHGHIEGEAHVAFGKKYGFPCSKDYVFRWWNVASIGIAEIGSAWLRGNVYGEYNSGRQKLRGFIKTLWGCGGNPLNPRHFHGYGKIRHRSIEMGARYSIVIDELGTFSLQYARRLWAKNFPEKANLLLFEYYYPFGSQAPCNY